MQLNKKQTNYLIEKRTKDMNKIFWGMNTNANKVLIFDFLIKKWNLKQLIQIAKTKSVMMSSAADVVRE